MDAESKQFFKKHEFEMIGHAIVALLRQKRNGTKLADFEGTLKNLKKSMRATGKEAGMEEKDINKTVRVISQGVV